MDLLSNFSNEKKLAISSTASQFRRLGVHNEELYKKIKESFDLTEEQALYAIEYSFHLCKKCLNVFSHKSGKGIQGYTRTYCSIKCIVEDKQKTTQNGCIELHFNSFCMGDTTYGSRHAYHIYKGIPYNKGSRRRNTCGNKFCVNEQHAIEYKTLVSGNIFMDPKKDTHNSFFLIRELYNSINPNIMNDPMYQQTIKQTIVSQIAEDIVRGTATRARFGVMVLNDFVKYCEKENEPLS